MKVPLHNTTDVYFPGGCLLKIVPLIETRLAWMLTLYHQRYKLSTRGKPDMHQPLSPSGIYQALFICGLCCDAGKANQVFVLSAH